MADARVAGIKLNLSARQVEQRLAKVEPEPIHRYYTVVNGRRFPLKQVVSLVTDVNKAEITTQKARSILRHLGFGVHRRQAAASLQHPQGARIGPGTPRSRGAVPVDAFVGRWVAQVGDDVLFDAEAPEAVVAWLRRHGRAARVWRVPASPRDAGSAHSTP